MDDRRPLALGVVQGLLERFDECFPKSAHFVYFAVLSELIPMPETARFSGWLVGLRVGKKCVQG